MDLEIVLLLVISFILGFISSRHYYNNIEPIVNLDDSRKVELSKCCADDKCYSKPPHLRKDCLKNKEAALKKIEQQFTEMYTQDEYYKQIDKLGIIANKTNFERDKELLSKLNEQLNLNNRLDQATFDNIRNDSRDEVRGGTVNNYTSYKSL
jgi:hypothetical protein